MSTFAELNKSFDKMEATALRCKAERDVLLEACRAALYALGERGPVAAHIRSAIKFAEERE